MTQSKIWREVKPAVSPHVKNTIRETFEMLKSNGLFKQYMNFEEWRKRNEV